MARKRREPSPPPPQESSTEEASSGDEEEEEAGGTPANQKTPQNPKAPSATAAKDADSSDGSDEEQEEGASSDSDVDAEAFQLRKVARTPSKPQAPSSKLESDAGEDERQGESAESEPDSPELVQKKAAKKSKAEAEKKRPAPELSPAGKAKKAKAGVEKVALSPFGKAKKAKEGPEKGEGKKPRSDPEKAALDPSPKPKRPTHRWTIQDEIRILESVVGHLKSQGTHPSAVDLLAAVGDSLDRKNCSKIDIYEKVRGLKKRYAVTAEKVASTGTLPENEDELQVYKLSEAAWGENAKEVASASVSQIDGALSKSKKGQATKEKIGGDSKGRPSKEATATATPVKSKKRGNHKEELDEDAKGGASKETITTAPQNGGTSTRIKSGKSDEEKMNGDAETVLPKEDIVATQNGEALTKSKNGETENGEMEGDDNVQGINKRFDELQNLYPNLSSYVEKIKAEHPCGETLKRLFVFIDDEKACALESKIKKQRVAEFKTQARLCDAKKEVANILIGLLD